MRPLAAPPLLRGLGPQGLLKEIIRADPGLPRESYKKSANFLDKIPSSWYVYVMGKNYHRKKQPDLVRERLLGAALEMALESGLGAITLEGVARGAGVSKGGLLHHFPSRRALIEGLARHIINRFSEDVNDVVAMDEEASGRFTRAYVRASVGRSDSLSLSRSLGALHLSMFMDNDLAALWRNWLREQLSLHGENENSVMGRLLRLSVDGIWLDDLTGAGQLDFSSRSALVSRLVDMTYEI